MVKRLKDAVLKIDPDWFMYFIGQPDYEPGDKLEIGNPIEEWDTLNHWIVSELEHELDIHDECRELKMENISWVTSKNIRQVKRVLDNYYNGKYIEE